MKTCNICGEKLKKTENFDEVVFECMKCNKALQEYMKGFKDELNNEAVNCDSKAYKLGALHAIIGDDNFNIDMLSDEDILIMIHNEQYIQA